jgi:hypothetical protein
MNEDDMKDLRLAIVESLPLETSTYGAAPLEGRVYVPPSHIKALRLECNLVIGARGVGKTFWTAALSSETTRKVLGKSITDLSSVRVHTGFGERPSLNDYPDADVFGSLLTNNAEPYHVWRAVLGRWLSFLVGESIPSESWESTVAWVKSNSEELSRLLEKANTKMEKDNTHGLIVFDALDRTSADWRTMDIIVRDLLRVVLSLKRFSRLHGKVFLREDQFNGRQVTDFPDSSKLLATRVELTWAANDLHGLLWQHLCNSVTYGEKLRDILTTSTRLPAEKVEGVWIIPDAIKRNETLQRGLFAALAGDWMGKDRRRGVPYVWSVSHLADGRGRTSPRSFLAAIRAAAEESQERYSDYRFALHYESIKRGVQKASEIRVSELSEDYPWIQRLMQPLNGVTVPCAFEIVEQRWISEFGSSPASFTFGKLPPEHYSEGWIGIRSDIKALGIFESMKDDRVNMPDLYRVGFGLGRRGGVKPIVQMARD